MAKKTGISRFIPRRKLTTEERQPSPHWILPSGVGEQLWRAIKLLLVFDSAKEVFRPVVFRSDRAIRLHSTHDTHRMLCRSSGNGRELRIGVRIQPTLALIFHVVRRLLGHMATEVAFDDVQREIDSRR